LYLAAINPLSFARQKIEMIAQILCALNTASQFTPEEKNSNSVISIGCHQRLQPEKYGWEIRLGRISQKSRFANIFTGREKPG